MSKILTNLGWQKVIGWECLWEHAEKSQFLSVFVDDFKMSGKATTHQKAWDEIREKLKLDDPVPFDKSVYFGYEQGDTKIDHAHISRKQEQIKNDIGNGPQRR